MSIFVDAKGKMITDSQREVDLAHGVGRKVETVDEPAGDKEAPCQAARREVPRLRFRIMVTGRLTSSVHVLAVGARQPDIADC